MIYLFTPYLFKTHFTELSFLQPPYTLHIAPSILSFTTLIIFGNTQQYRSQVQRGLRRRFLPLARWNCGFEFTLGHGYLSLVIVVCFQGQISATSWLFVKRSPTECGASLCVIYKPHELGGRGPRLAAAQQKNTQEFLSNSLWRCASYFQFSVVHVSRNMLLSGDCKPPPHMTWWRLR